MFTGIVSAIGRIVDVTPLGAGESFGKSLAVETPRGWLDGVAIGDSILVAGACMTVVTLDTKVDRFAFEVSAESLACTAGLDATGEVNLEKSLHAGDRLDGHLVSGHVDGVGRVARIAPVGESHELRIAAPRALARFLAVKGSVAVDGTSLTINRVDDGDEACEFSVNLIAHTLARTTLKHLVRGSRVNLEVDVVARYVARMLGIAATSRVAGKPGGDGTTEPRADDADPAATRSLARQ